VGQSPLARQFALVTLTFGGRVPAGEFVFETVILASHNEKRFGMANVTLVFAVLLAGLGLGSYLGTGSQHPTALIPVGFGVLLGIFGFLAMSPNEGRRKVFMHINVTIGMLGFLGTVAEIYRNLSSTKELDLIALAEKLGLAWLLLIYVILCVWSFLVARRTEKA
jgi:hypothetical protein